jgi:acyl transferase domain-containing protein/NAD(P)-dependent dehydrogenase (short-subunit alcohol dehydrogenase family)/acyl carrier protein
MRRVAVIGAQCRFPGNADTPSAFFRGLMAGETHCVETPATRWATDRFSNDHPVAGKTPVTRGHFIEYDFTAFDARAFGFAPAEVEAMDPQQRLLLETAWQALDDAGVDHRRVRGTDVGVYVGGFTSDHLLNLFSSRTRAALGRHSAAGATLTMLANRISHAFDLRGPSLTIDTACSSSLVAFALAVEDIRSGRCRMALVGGVNFMLRPEYTIAMSKGGFLAPDGRSKSFAAAADGYGRGEGCGILVLKEAAAARADGDKVLAEVDGAGFNHNGRTSGISLPNRDAQASLMARVATESGVDPASVLYVEAHGTGTPVGDPLEATAIAEVYGRIARQGPCAIGSVKANIGHPEAAAGVAGLIKAIWMLRENRIPPLALDGAPNPDIPFRAHNLELVTKARPLASPGQTRRVAINAFGYGGANAHAILSLPDPGPSRPRSAAARPSDAPAPDALAEVLVPVSAQTPTALRGYARALGTALPRASGSEIDDLLYSNACRRTHFAERAIVWGATVRDVARDLMRFADGDASQSMIAAGEPGLSGRGTVFVYSGMGPQWWGMGRALYDANPVYRAALEEFDTTFVGIAGVSILAELLRDEHRSRITRPQHAQPANFALQYALTRALGAEGMQPDAVVGHSVGEVTSAWASGMLSLDDAIRVSWHRSRLQATAAGQGAMIAVALSPDDATRRIARFGDTIDIAAVNAPSAVTLSGRTADIDDLHAELCLERIRSRRLDLNVPYHSRAMDSLMQPLRDNLAELRPRGTRLRLYSTVTGAEVGDAPFDAAYWAANIRQPVRFRQAVEAILDDGYLHFVEIGPHSVLGDAIRQTVARRAGAASVVATLDRAGDDVARLRGAVARHYLGGGELDWRRRHPLGELTTFPAYPWDRQVLWREAESQRADRQDAGPRGFGETWSRPGATFADLNRAQLNFLRDHRVDGTAIMPAAGYLEAFATAAETPGPGAVGWVLRDVAFRAALVQNPHVGLVLETRLFPETGAAGIWGYDDVSGAGAQLYATADVRASPRARPKRAVALATLLAETPRAVDVTLAYRRFARLGLNYGPTFRPVSELRHSTDRTVATARLALPPELSTKAGTFIAHPVLVDGGFQTALSLVEDDIAWLPAHIAELRIYAEFPVTLWVRARLVRRASDEVVCDIDYVDDAGHPLARLVGLCCRAVPRGAMTPPPLDLAYDWIERAESRRPAARALFVIGDAEDRFAAQFTDRCRSAGFLRGAAVWGHAALDTTLRQASRPDGPAVAVVLICTAGAGDADPIGLRAAQYVIAAVQQLREVGGTPPRTYLLTRDAVATRPGDPVMPAQSTLYALGRALYNESEELDVTVLDLDARRPDFDHVLAEILAGGASSEVAFRAGHRLIPMLRATGAFRASPVRDLPPDAHAAIDFSAAPPVEHVLLDPAPGEVVIAFDAVVLPPLRPRKPHRMGFSGAVIATGPGPARWQVGTWLCGIAPVGFRTVAGFAADSLMATGYATAPQAPEVLARVACIDWPVLRLAAALTVGPGDRCLVVETLAGLVLANLLDVRGCEVTRVPPEHAALDEEGFALIAAPGDLFTSQIGFRALRPGGWLVDLDPTAGSIALPAHVGGLCRLATFLGGGTTGDSADLDRVLRAPPSGRATGTVTSWDHWTEAAAGASDMVTITMARPRTIEIATHGQPRFRRDRSYLVTGGLGGFGRRTALWLARNGAGHIVLCGRRSEAEEYTELLGALSRLGARGERRQVDVADPAQVATLFASLDSDGARLAGVFHAAGVLVDKPAFELTADDMATVMRPKAGGAWALHMATKDRPLDHFVLFSSIAATVGNSGQANYCAANGFLDGLAHLRVSLGLPGTSINFGAIAGVGMTADPRVAAHLHAAGLTPLDADRALHGLGIALTHGWTQIVIAEALDIARWSRYEPRCANSERMSELMASFPPQTAETGVGAFRSALAQAMPSDRVALMSSRLVEIIAGELRLLPSSVNVSHSLPRLGVDSLMALEIQVIAERALGITIPVPVLMSGVTIAEIALFCLSMLMPPETDEPAPVAGH